MQTNRRDLGSVNALVTFEAAARLGSFTVAAAELGVTQAAVSRQIRNLETEFGIKLFQRLYRRVEPTETGSVLAAALTQSLDQIGDALRSLRQAAATDELTVCSTVALSHFWLLPSISSFRAEYPAVNLRIIAQDTPVDLLRDGIDVLVRYETGPLPHGQSVLLAKEEVFPVCSSAFLQRAGAIDTIAQLLQQPLIAADATDPSWIGWSEWLAAIGHKRKVSHSLRLSHYTDAIFAAIEGQGVALGWGRLLARELAESRLIRVTSAAVEPAGGYYLAIPSNRTRKQAAADFGGWAERVLAPR